MMPQLAKVVPYFAHIGEAIRSSDIAADGLPSVAPNLGFTVAVRSEGWWRRSQRIRTEGAIPFEVAIVEPPEVPTYIGIAEKALHLKELNMNPNQIAVALKVDRTTVLRALRWVKSITVYATGPSRN